MIYTKLCELHLKLVIFTLLQWSSLYSSDLHFTSVIFTLVIFNLSQWSSKFKLWKCLLSGSTSVATLVLSCSHSPSSSYSHSHSQSQSHSYIHSQLTITFFESTNNKRGRCMPFATLHYVSMYVCVSVCVLHVSLLPLPPLTSLPTPLCIMTTCNLAFLFAAACIFLGRCCLWISFRDFCFFSSVAVAAFVTPASASSSSAASWLVKSDCKLWIELQATQSAGVGRRSCHLCCCCCRCCSSSKGVWAWPLHVVMPAVSLFICHHLYMADRQRVGSLC